MSVGKQKFVEFRKKALDERKKRLLDSTNSNVATVPHIAAVLQKSAMIASKIIKVICLTNYSSW